MDVFESNKVRFMTKSSDVQYERLRPAQIVARRQACPVAYLPELRDAGVNMIEEPLVGVDRFYRQPVPGREKLDFTIDGNYAMVCIPWVCGVVFEK